MKKIINVVICFCISLVLCSCTFTGDLIDNMANNVPVEKTFEFDGLKIDLTTEFLTMDFIDESYDFIVGDGIVTVIGSFAPLDEETLGTFSTYEYAVLYRDSLDAVTVSDVEEVNSIPTLKYTSMGEDGELSYLCAFYKSPDGIWVIMFGMDSKDYDASYDACIQYASTVRFTDRPAS